MDPPSIPARPEAEILGAKTLFPRTQPAVADDKSFQEFARSEIRHSDVPALESELAELLESVEAGIKGAESGRVNDLAFGVQQMKGGDTTAEKSRLPHETDGLARRRIGDTRKFLRDQTLAEKHRAEEQSEGQEEGGNFS